MTEVRMQGVGDPHRHDIPEAHEKKTPQDKARAERLERERRARALQSKPSSPLKKPE